MAYVTCARVRRNKQTEGHEDGEFYILDQFIIKKSKVTRQIWFILKLFDHFILKNVTTRKLTVCNLGMSKIAFEN